ncbi:MAG: RNA-guided pseudouridylation complex pseudouridine synthase subunit Cbf5 [Thermoplasmatota archaeon]
MSSPHDDAEMETIRPSETDIQYGKDPYRRSISQLLDSGFVPLDKPRGPTSHQVASWLKEILDIEKAGHMGTLDPNTTGVLPIALGSSVRTLSVTLSEGKEYVALIQFHGDVQEKELMVLAKEFTGDIYQLVPVRSAVKRGLRTRRIHYLNIPEMGERSALMIIGCESGTYIRTLIHDIGLVLGTGAHMTELRRSRSGNIREDACATLQEVRDAWETYRSSGSEEEIRRVVRPIEEMLSHLPRVVIKDSAVDAVCHGAPLGHPGIVSVQTGIRDGAMVLITSLKGEAVAIGKTMCSTTEALTAREGLAVVVDRVLMEPGTYPRSWKVKK